MNEFKLAFEALILAFLDSRVASLAAYLEAKTSQFVFGHFAL